MRVLLEALLLTISTLALIFGVVWLAFAVANRSCSAQAEMMGFEHRFNVWTTCMVRVDSQWIPLSAYKTARLR